METDRKQRQPTKRIMRKPRFAEVLCDMPALSNSPPYDDNEVSRWFAKRYFVTLTEAKRLFDNARSQSAKSRHPFLAYDRERKLWHGVKRA
jgi:hypothetical protein